MVGDAAGAAVGLGIIAVGTGGLALAPKQQRERWFGQLVFLASATSVGLSAGPCFGHHQAIACGVLVLAGGSAVAVAASLAVNSTVLEAGGLVVGATGTGLDWVGQSLGNRIEPVYSVKDPRRPRSVIH